MARVRPLIVARKLSGYVVPNAEVYIYERDDTEDVSAHAKVELDLYTTEAGGTTITQPLQTDSRGIAETFFMEPTSYDRRVVHAGDDFIVHDEALTAQDMGGREIAYAEITTNFATASLTPVDATGLAFTATKTDRPLKIIFDCYGVANSSASGAAVVNLLKDGTIVKGGALSNIDANNTGASMHFEYVDRDDPGSYDYKIMLVAVTAGTATIVAATTLPCFIQAVEN